MHVSLIAHKERISVDEYYRLRHQLLSLRRRYAQTVCASDRTALPTEKLKRLERRIETLERRLAYADIDFPFETLSLHDILSGVKDVLASSTESMRRALHTAKRRRGFANFQKI